MSPSPHRAIGMKVSSNKYSRLCLSAHTTHTTHTTHTATSTVLIIITAIIITSGVYLTSGGTYSRVFTHSICIVYPTLHRLTLIESIQLVDLFSFTFIE